MKMKKEKKREKKHLQLAVVAFAVTGWGRGREQNTRPMQAAGGKKHSRCYSREWHKS
jgi:hypothetical protein